MKFFGGAREYLKHVGRSREGAWIEIISALPSNGFLLVTLARERGLKSVHFPPALEQPQVAPVRDRGLKYLRPSSMLMNRLVAPARERGLKCWQRWCDERYAEVAPVRERGLK